MPADLPTTYCQVRFAVLSVAVLICVSNQQSAPTAGIFEAWRNTSLSVPSFWTFWSCPAVEKEMVDRNWYKHCDGDLLENQVKSLMLLNVIKMPYSFFQ